MFAKRSSAQPVSCKWGVVVIGDDVYVAKYICEKNVWVIREGCNLEGLKKEVLLY